MECKKYNINELIPHSGEMIFISKVKDYTEKSISVEIVVHDSFGLKDGKGLGCPIAIEYMAQTAACLAGLREKSKGKKAGQVGFLLGTREIRFHTNCFLENQVLDVSIKSMWDDGNMGIFESLIKDKESKELLVEAKINVYMPSEDSELNTRFGKL